MNRIGILLAAVLCSFSALAQDTISTGNYSPISNTVPNLANVTATTNLTATERWMSLQDCIEIALQHNFTIQIAR